jgi:hypothetical protein
LPKNRLPGRARISLKTQLVIALAEGVSVRKWAAANNVVTRTAYRWAGEPEVRAEVERIRRAVVDQAVAVLAKHVTKASKGINRLAANAVSESARRAPCAREIAAPKSRSLKSRLAAVERWIRDRS